jgi:hypothetical protein
MTARLTKNNADSMNRICMSKSGCSNLCLSVEAQYGQLPLYDPVFRGFGGLFFGGIISSFLWMGIIKIVLYLL